MGLLGEIMVRFGADTSGFTASTSAAAASVASVGVATVSTSAYLDSLGASAFTTGAGFDGMAASAAAAAVSTAGVAASTAAVDTSLAGTAVASVDASTALQAVAVSEDEVAVSANTASASVGKGALVLAAMGAAVAVAAGASVKMAGDWQTSMTKLVTSGGESTSALKMVSAGLLDMAVQTGTSTGQMAKGMYLVESAGFHGASGMQVLKMAAMGAKAENADLGVVANAVTSALNAYGLGAGSAAAVTNTLVAATANGKMTMGDLSGAVSNVLPAAAKFHISLVDITAGIATMTMQGDDASSAATHLRQVILALESPAKAGAKALSEIGLSSQQVGDAMKKSLPGAIQMITDDLGKKFPEGSAAYNNAIKAIAGGNKQLLGLLELSGTSLGKYKDAVRNMTGQVKEGGASIAGWSLIQSNFNFKMDAAKAAIEGAAIKIGTALLPVLGQIVGAVTPIVVAFGNWITKANGLQAFLNDTSPKMLLLKAGIVALAGVIGGVMVFALVAFAVAAWAAIVPMLPFIAIGALVALAVVGIVLAIQHWGEIMHWIGGLFSEVGAQLRESATKVKNDVGGAFDSMGTQMRTSTTKVKNDVGGLFNSMGTDLRTSATKTKNDVGGAFDSMGTQMRQSATKTKNDVGSIMSGLGTIAHSAGVGIVQAGQWMYDHNYYWKAAADGIGKAFSGLGDDMRLSATKVKNDVGKIFDDMGTQLTKSSTKTNSDVGAQFSDMGTQMRQSANKTGNDVGNIFSTMGSHVSQAVDTMRANSGAGFSSLGSQANGVMVWVRTSVLDNIGRAVGGFMSGMGSLVSGAVSKLGELGGDFFSMMGSLASQAFGWGASIIQGIINGIGSMLSGLGSIASQAAGIVASALGFHSPTKVGPGRDADKWMPNLIKMMEAGLVAGEPTIKNAAIQVASMLSPMINVHSSGTIGANSTSGTSNNNGTQTIIIQMDGRDVAKALGPHLTNEIRLVAQVRR